MEGRDNNGRFTVGNKLNTKTFQKGNDFSDKYDGKYVQMVVDYFSGDIESESMDGNGRVYTKVNEFPTMYGFAFKIGVCYSTLKNWRKAHIEFDKACTLAENEQRHKMLSGAISGHYNAQMAKFLASAWYGLSEKVSNDTNMTVQVKMDRELEEESK